MTKEIELRNALGAMIDYIKSNVKNDIAIFEKLPVVF